MIKTLIAASICVYFVLMIVLILNIEEKSKIIKYSFLAFMLTLFLALFFVNEIVMDYLFSIIIRYFYFPTFSSIILTILVTMVIFIRNVFNDKENDKMRIINYVFGSFIFVGFILFMVQNIDVNSYTFLYDGYSLLCLKYISRTFILWQIVRLFILYFSYFVKR